MNNFHLIVKAKIKGHELKINEKSRGQGNKLSNTSHYLLKFELEFGIYVNWAMGNKDNR